MKPAFTAWFTGIPRSGKSTLALRLREALNQHGVPATLLDGDEIRKTFWPELGFSKADRDENIRRFSRLAKLFNEQGVIAIVAVISPYREARQEARKLIHHFVEVYLDCPPEVCASRDPTGMYEKAWRGEISHFTGVSDPYEPPSQPELVLNTAQETPDESFQKILHYLRSTHWVNF